MGLRSLALENGGNTVPQLFEDGNGGSVTTPDPKPGHTEAKTAADTDPEMGPTEAKNTAFSDPVLGHIIKHINKENFGETAAPLKKFPVYPFENAAIKRVAAPNIETVDAYFLQRSYPTVEAKKFFLHYESTGWMTGGHTPVTNWQAAADKWMLNDRSLYKIKTHAKQLQPAANNDTSAPKNYSIPF